MFTDRATLEAACQAGARALVLPDGRILCRILGGPLLYTLASDYTFSPHVAFSGFWEGWITLAMARLLRPGMRCVDAGANSGYYTVLMGYAVGPTGHVCAVEPHPDVAACLRWSVEINGLQGRTTVVEAALGAEAGEAWLATDPARLCLSSLVTRQGVPLDGPAHPVPVVSLDSLTAAWPAGGPLLIKVDVEGMEQEVWAGMQETLARFPTAAIIMEVQTARYADPHRFYTAIATQFPLRYITYDGDILPTTLPALLTLHPTEDWLLYLQRGRVC